MIKVRYNTACNRVTVQGHAGAAPKGEDLVCSAASILVHTLAANVWCMEQAHLCSGAVVDIKEGFAEVSCKAISGKVSCKARRGYENAVSSMFHAVCIGFEVLAENYPENVSFILVP